jgi:hypothetical protein
LFRVNTGSRFRVFLTERAFYSQGDNSMNLNHSSVRYLSALLLAVLIFTTSAVAGPPLLCHAFDIGNAKSLPWISHDWNLTGRESYDTNNLVNDTITILDNDATVLVHMETLRRATLYAQLDPLVAKHLLIKLMARSDSAGQTLSAPALALFDLGYFAESLHQFHWTHKDAPNPAQGLDGFTLVDKAIQLRGNDPQMEFAAAIITLNVERSKHAEHAQKAITGAKNDPLLARNLSAHFRDTQSETMAEMISRTPSVKVAQQ